VLPLSRAAIAVGADGIIVDVHPHPAAAMCDGDQALTGEDIRDLGAMVHTLPQMLGRTLTPAQQPAKAASATPVA
jgi:3-deoxy-7-phosphoheptulonate synthase